MAMDYDTGHNDEAGDQPMAHYVPTQPYEDRRNMDMPRIMVPPPNIDYESGKASFQIPAPEFARLNASCGDPEFLSSILNHCPLSLEHGMLQWKYEMRKNVQSILPFLIIGPSTEARIRTCIESNGITYLLAVRSTQIISKHPNYLNPARFSSLAGLNIQTATFDLDHPYELISGIKPVVKSINDHLKSSCIQFPITSIDDIRGRVMMFCETGNERSAVVVAAYLMVIFGIDAVPAIQIIQSQRFCTNVVDEMKSMLVALEGILRAEKMVATNNMAQAASVRERQEAGQSALTLNKSSKRNIDRSYEDDDDMEDVGDWNGNGGQRVGVAPFADT